MRREKEDMEGKRVRFGRLIVLTVTALFSGLLCLIVAVDGRAEAMRVGRIAGRVVDSASGQALIGTTVRLADTKLGAVADIDGNYLIRNVPAGTYTLAASSIGYNSTRVTEVVVAEGEVATLNLSLSEQTTVLTTEISVTAKRATNNESYLLHERQKSNTVSDAISAETISRSGGGSAAQAMMRVTGASVADGKYAVIRGLGDRYSNTRLNGSALPSADPEKQAFAIDLVPSDLLDNIVVTKSYSVDQPGNFTGGSVNLVTKDFPEKRTMSLSIGSSANSMVSGKEVLASPSSATDWIGHDNGLRGIPQFIQDNIGRIPRNNVIYRKPSNSYTGDTQAALFLDSITNAFHPQYNHVTKLAPLNQNYAFTYGDNLSVFGRSLGLIGNLTYNRSQSAYQKGDENLYAPLTGTTLDAVDLLKDDRGVDDVLLGGLASLHYNLVPNHKLGVGYVLNRNGRSETRFLRGYLNDYDPGQTWESHDNRYAERSLHSVQFNGDHQLKLGFPVRLDWQYSDSRIAQHEILQEFLFEIGVDSTVSPWDTSTLGTTSSQMPSVYYRNIDETNRQIDANLKVFLTKSTSVKLGASYLDKKRSLRQTVFKYQIDNLQLLRSVHGDMNAFADSAGLADTSGMFYSYNAYLYVFPTTSDEYDGRQTIPAWYVQLETPLIANLKLVGGVRHERTDMSAHDLTAVHAGGQIHGSDWLPSASLTYSVTPKMNVRAVFSRTLARPTVREIAGFRNSEFAASKYFYGNPKLKPSRIANYDLRWEWFNRPGEILAVSAFYKNFTDPIEIAYKIENYDRLPVNASQARNFGLEFEARTCLDQVSDRLRNVSIGSNLTLVNSRIKIPTDELALMRNLDSTVSDTRPMANQSPYIVNVDLSYDNAKSGTNVSLLYNVFGRRFYYNAQGAAPDIYEMPRKQLDMTISQKIFFSITLKASARNLLNSHFEADYYYTGSGNRVVFEKHDLGRSFSFGLSSRVI